MQGVPGHYIKQAPVDWQLEFVASAGGSLRIGRAQIPAVSFGVWAMLELIDCDFVHPQKEPTAGGAIVAAYLCAAGKDAMPLVQRNLSAGLEGVPLNLDEPNPGDALGIAAMIWATDNALEPDDLIKLQEWLNVSFSGFGMIPSGDGGGEYIFGVDSFGAMVASVGADLGIDHERLMWQTPLCLIGHAVAQKSKQNGAKGIARAKDPAHIKQQFEEAQRRHDAGELYEWQEKEPLRYGLDGHENDDEAYRFAVLQHEARTKGAA
jgi:hypothetical protein